MTNPPHGRENRMRAIAQYAPLIILVLAVLYLSVNIPNWDEWDNWMAGVSQLSKAPFTWEYFWHSHNGHRLPLTWFLLWLFSHLHLGPKPLMILQTFVWMTNIALFWKCFADVQKRLSALALFLISAFFLSFVQREIFFMSITIHAALVTTALLLFVHFVIRRNVSGSLLSIGLGILSFSNWVCFIPAFVVARAREKFPKFDYLAVTLVVITAAGILIYLPNHHLGEGAKAVSLSPGLMIAAFFRVLGNPLVMTGKYQNIYFHLAAMAAGLFFAVAYVKLFFLSPRADRTKAGLLLCTYSLCAAALLGLSRGSLGLDAIGQSSRYAGMIVPGWCGLMIELIATPQAVKFGKRSAYAILFVALISSLLNLSAEAVIRRPKFLAAQATAQKIVRGDPISFAEEDSFSAVYPDKIRPVQILAALKNESEISNFYFMIE